MKIFNRKNQDRAVMVLIYGAASFTVLILGIIIMFIFFKGMPAINFNFLTRNYEDETTYINVNLVENSIEKENYLNGLMAYARVEENHLIIYKLDKTSPLKSGVNMQGDFYKVSKNDYITKIDDINISNLCSEGNQTFVINEINDYLSTIENNTVKIKTVKPGGGIIPMLVTTVYMILLTISIAAPLGIVSAIYLIEYGKKGKLINLIHFAIKNLAGIPSIIYGLFGSLFFVQICKMQYSILAGAMTLSIILLPTIITTTQEALKSIPNSYREASLGLGGTKLQTIFRVVLPNAIPGILVAVLLSIGRIIGESAALLLTAGTVANIPKTLFGNSSSGATLTIKAYTLMMEENDLTTACGIGIILIVLIIIINLVSKYITAAFMKKKGAF